MPLSDKEKSMTSLNSTHSVTRTAVAGYGAIPALLLALVVVVATPFAVADEAVYHAPGGRDGAPFSEAVVYDDFIFLAGQLGIVPGTRELAEGGIQAETRQALENMQGALERAGGSMDSVLKCTVFLADIADWAAMNEVYVTFFPNKPARSAIGDISLALDARVEIECMAAAPDEDEEDGEDEEAEEETEAPGS
jgi:reactive intermediate/imine deaminase